MIAICFDIFKHLHALNTTLWEAYLLEVYIYMKALWRPLFITTIAMQD